MTHATIPASDRPHQAAKRYLLRAQQDAPVVVFLNQTAGIAKFLHRGVHGRQLTPKRAQEGSVKWFLASIRRDLGSHARIETWVTQVP